MEFILSQSEFNRLLISAYFPDVTAVALSVTPKHILLSVIVNWAFVLQRILVTVTNH